MSSYVVKRGDDYLTVEGVFSIFQVKAYRFGRGCALDVAALRGGRIVKLVPRRRYVVKSAYDRYAVHTMVLETSWTSDIEGATRMTKAEAEEEVCVKAGESVAEALT